MNLENIMLYEKKHIPEGLCGSPVADSILPLHGAQVRSPVRELRSNGQKIYIYIHIYIYIYTHTHISSVSIHLLMDASFSILVIVNNAAINVRVQRTGIV